MTNIIVTSGAGFTGANCVHHWRTVATDSGTVVLDALTYAGNCARIRKNRRAAHHG